MNYSELNKLMELVNCFVNCGVKAFVVGGAIRNDLLELPIKDIDIAVPHTPAEMLSLLPDSATLISSAQAYPVVSFLGFEIASFRKDGLNRQDATGISVGATMLEDASRRDFTINALYTDLDYGFVHYLSGKPQWTYDPEDPTGQGINDIDNGLIRLIGNPEERLAEDPLRALRAYRFLATLPGFTLEENTKLACDNVLKNVRMKV